MKHRSDTDTAPGNPGHRNHQGILQQERDELSNDTSLVWYHKLGIVNGVWRLFLTSFPGPACLSLAVQISYCKRQTPRPGNKARLFYLIHRRLLCTQAGRSRFPGHCHTGLILDQTRRCNFPGILHHKYRVGKLDVGERESGGERRKKRRERKRN